MIRFLEETQSSFHSATQWRDSANNHASLAEATKAALVAAGWKAPGKHDDHPRAPRLAGEAYAYGEQVSGATVSLELRNLTAAQAIAIIGILRA